MSCTRRWRPLLFALALAVPGRAAWSQQDPTRHVLEIPSATLGEIRRVDVALPARYAEMPGQRFPVLVVLDGDWMFDVAVTVTRFYAGTSQLPPMIVVGVRTADRNRDFTPPPAPGFRVPDEVKAPGGAPRFLAFLERELMAHLDSSYRTASVRVLVGHSLAGLLALHAVAHGSGVLNGFVISEPSTWWNDHRPHADASAALRQPRAARLRVVTVNTSPLGVDTTRWGGDAPMVRELQIAGETHTSVVLDVIARGLRTMFSDTRPVAWRPGTRPTMRLAAVDSVRSRLGWAPPISAETFAGVIRMSIHGRFFDDAERDIGRMEREYGATPLSAELRGMLAQFRGSPTPASFVPLEIPARRPSPAAAARYIGRWENTGSGSLRAFEIAPSADTLVLRAQRVLGDGTRLDETYPIIQLRPDGTLEWGLTVFRGVPALLVLTGKPDERGVLRFDSEVRGFVPMGPSDTFRIEGAFRRRDAQSSGPPHAAGMRGPAPALPSP